MEDPFLDDYVIVHEFYPISSLSFVIVVGVLVGSLIGCCTYNFVKSRLDRRPPAESTVVELPEVRHDRHPSQLQYTSNQNYATEAGMVASEEGPDPARARRVNTKII